MGEIKPATPPRRTLVDRIREDGPFKAGDRLPSWLSRLELKAEDFNALREELLTGLAVTPREAAALARLLDSHLSSEECDPEAEDLQTLRAKLGRLEQSHRDHGWEGRNGD